MYYIYCIYRHYTGIYVALYQKDLNTIYYSTAVNPPHTGLHRRLGKSSIIEFATARLVAGFSCIF